MIREEEVYRIGRIGRPHGVKGEVQLQFSDDVFDRVEAEYLVLRVDGLLVPFFMEEYRFRSDSVALVKFCDIDTQQRAAELTGSEVFFPRRLADSDTGEYTWASLPGITLVDSNTGTAAGRIVSIDETTQNFLFELEDGTLIPAAEELIVNIDAKKQQIDINLPQGILEL